VSYAPLPTAAELAEFEAGQQTFECVVCDQLIYHTDGSWWHFAPNPDDMHTPRPNNDGVL
jgi:hypothetical protein